jgi:hypothetical protein
VVAWALGREWPLGLRARQPEQRGPALAPAARDLASAQVDLVRMSERAPAPLPAK